MVLLPSAFCVMAAVTDVPGVTAWRRARSRPLSVEYWILLTPTSSVAVTLIVTGAALR